jgi:hypothetical protein
MSLTCKRKRETHSFVPLLFVCFFSSQKSKLAQLIFNALPVCFLLSFLKSTLGILLLGCCCHCHSQFFSIRLSICKLNFLFLRFSSSDSSTINQSRSLLIWFLHSNVVSFLLSHNILFAYRYKIATAIINWNRGTRGFTRRPVALCAKNI